MDPAPTITQDTVRDWMIGYISAALEVPRAAIATDTTFDTYGFDSAEAVIMAGVMEEEFGIETDPAAFFEHPTIDGVAGIVVRLCGKAGR
jgi:acyl carrier protein